MSWSVPKHVGRYLWIAHAKTNNTTALDNSVVCTKLTLIDYVHFLNFLLECMHLSVLDYLEKTTHLQQVYRCACIDAPLQSTRKIPVFIP